MHPLANAADPEAILAAELDRRRAKAKAAYAAFDRERTSLAALGVDPSKDEQAFKRLESLYKACADAEQEYAALEQRALERLEERAKRQGLLDRLGGRSLGHVLADGLKALETETGSGQYLVPPDYLPRVWDRLRERSVGLLSGFTTVPTGSSEIRVPRLTASATAGWTAEGDPIAESAPTIDEIVVKPSKLAALVSMTNELRSDSPPELLQIVFDDLVAKLAATLDRGFYEGSGVAPEILGIKNVAGIQTVSMGTNGAAFTNLDPIADAIGLLEEADAEATAIVMHPRTWADLLRLKEDSTDSLKPLLADSAGSPTQGVRRSIYGVPVLLSSQLSTSETQGTSNNASSVYVYQADQVVAVRREEMRLEIDGSEKFSSDVSLVRAVLRYGLAVPNPVAVCRIVGVIPAP